MPMSIPIGFTEKELKTLKKELVKEQTIHCLDRTSFLKTNLAGLYFAERGVEVKANVVYMPTPESVAKESKPTAAFAEDLLENVIDDRDATQRMIDNPDATLAHAMTHLFAVSGEYAPYTYWQAITTLQDLRNDAHWGREIA
jgi:hypothetical protein